MSTFKNSDMRIVLSAGNGNRAMHFKLRKAIISYIIFVRLSVRVEQFDCPCTDFDEILYLISSKKKSFGNFQILLKSDKNNGYFT
jgi:hypothetical protein